MGVEKSVQDSRGIESVLSNNYERGPETNQAVENKAASIHQLQEMRKFKPVQAMEWVQPIRKGYKMACCDCGLVHVLNFRLVKNQLGPGVKIQFQADRDNRSTAQLRRHKKKKK